jgi:hypothetical protein
MFSLAAASAVLAGYASLAERRRLKRRNLDQVGWVPWPHVQVLAVLGTVVAIVLAFKLK